jgi:DNA-binding IclR family transcriptional regulator
MGFDKGTLEGGQYSQTLDRGLRALEHLAASRAPLTVAEVARLLGVHRSIAYRLLRTLEAHRLITACAGGRYGLGLGLLSLAKQVDWDLRDAALPVLTRLVDKTGATAVLSVLDGDEAVTLVQAVPREGAHISLGEGVRHPLDRGSPGIAILAGMPARAGERPAVSQARKRGFARSEGELASGTVGISAGVPVAGGTAVSVAVSVVFVRGEKHDEAFVAAAVQQAAAEIAAHMP